MLLPVDFNRQGVEVRLLRGPEGRLFHGDGDFGPPVAGEFSLSADQLPAFACQGKAVLTGPGGKHGDDQVRIPVAVIEQCFNLQVLDMAGRNRIEIDIPEDAGEAEEVLILSPGSGREAEDHGRELVRTFPVDIFRQVEFRRRERVFAVADVVAVQPEGHGRLRPLEGDTDRSLLPPVTFWQCEVLGVHGHGIKDGRDISRFQFLHPLPGVLGVHILGSPKAFRLDVGRNPDAVPLVAVVVCPVEVLYGRIVVFGPGELPDSVQHEFKVRPAAFYGPFAAVPLVVRMGRQAVFLEDFRILHNSVVEFGHDFPPQKAVFCAKRAGAFQNTEKTCPQVHSFLSRRPPKERPRRAVGFLYYSQDYLTEPVIPSAKLFCSTKKIIIVGTEQNRTPIISIP